MSWGLVAVAGATLVGGVLASKSAGDASDAASASASTQLAFDQQRLDDWNTVYGPVQDNLSDYYSKVTPEYYAATGLEEFEKAKLDSVTRMDEYLAQRGLVGSGIEASLKAQTELNAAETKAEIRRDAPRLAAEDQSHFLQIGLGQNPTSSVSQTLSQQTAYSQNQANQANVAAGEALASAGPVVGRAVDAYTNRPTTATGGTQMTGSPYINPNQRIA